MKQKTIVINNYIYFASTRNATHDQTTIRWSAIVNCVHQHHVFMSINAVSTLFDKNTSMQCAGTKTISRDL